jgi:hypothetical protein
MACFTLVAVLGDDVKPRSESEAFYTWRSAGDQPWISTSAKTSDVSTV